MGHHSGHEEADFQTKFPLQFGKCGDRSSYAMPCNHKGKATLGEVSAGLSEKVAPQMEA